MPKELVMTAEHPDCVWTGPVGGSVTLADGTAYDVTPDFVPVASGHGNRVAFHIAKIHEASGRLTKLHHGDEYDGPCSVSVPGDEDSFGPETQFVHSPECQG